MLKIIKNKFFLFVICTVSVMWIIFLFVSFCYFLEPLGDSVSKEYRAMSSDMLVKDLNHFSSYRQTLAWSNLVDRKDDRVLPYILKRIKRRSNYLWGVQALGRLGNKEAIPVIHDVLSKQKDRTVNNDIYWKSVESLALLKDESTWPLVLKLANSYNEGEVRLAVEAFVAFGKLEALPYLEKCKERFMNNDYNPLLRKIDGKDTEVWVLSMSDIEDAIIKLKEVNGIESI